MRGLRKTALCAALFAGLAAACGEVRGQQENDPVAAMTEQIENFFSNLADPNYSASFVFAEFVADSPLEPQTADLKKLVDQFNGLQEKYGKYLEVERVDFKTIGKDLVILRFLYKMERFPVVWYFTYYRAPSADNGSWKLVSLKFDTRLHLLAN